MVRLLSIEQFDNLFRSAEDCRQHLFKVKWKKGYCCRRCDSKRHHQGKTNFHLRCNGCGYDESITANTAFHKLKIPLMKAFRMCYRIAVKKKGMSTLELAREFSINRKSSWLFKRKAQEVMRDMDLFELIRTAAKELAKINGRLHTPSALGYNGRSLNKVRLKSGQQNSKTLSGKMLLNAAHRYLGAEMGSTAKGNHNMGGKRRKGGKKISLINLQVMNFRDWVRGTHHHCTEQFVNGYLDEFYFRYSERNALEAIWEKLIERFMTGTHYLYRETLAKGCLTNVSISPVI